jgi:serine/threonine-protein kinase
VTRQRRVGRRGRSGSFPVIVALSVTSALVVLLGLSADLNPLKLLSGAGLRVEVPQVAGLSQTRAQLRLDQGSLHGRTKFQPSVKVDRGLVIGTVPRAGDEILRGSDVIVVVSTGPSLVTVPDLVGKTEPDATKALKDLALLTKVDSRNDEAVPKGQVISQTPVKDEVISGGDTVSLLVSLGPANRPVPDVSKLPIEGAMFTLGKAGFTLGQIQNVNDASLPLNAVVSTSPAAGEVQPKDTPINLVVSNGAPDVQVPQVTGKSFDAATAQLSSVGLVAARISASGSTQTSGTVVGQNPAAGTTLKRGQVVTLQVVD